MRPSNTDVLFDDTALRMKLTILLFILSASSVVAQRETSGESYPVEDHPSPRGVLVSLRVGMVLTSPRQLFPSVRVGETTRGTGTVSSRDRGQTGVGSRVGIELMVPVAENLGIAADFANLVWSARFVESPGTLPITFNVQTLTVGLGLQGNIYTNRDAFLRNQGLRGIYLGGKLDVGITTLNNRIEAYTFPDSSATPRSAVGSFDNADPFRNLASVSAQLGARYGFGNLELTGELAYAYALNSVFSSLVVVDNEFTVDNAMLLVGIGYRW